MKAYVIDGNSLLFRGFYATSYGEGPIMRTKGGLPTNAIYAFGNMIARILHDVEKGDVLFVAFDADGHTFRKEEYEGYKATRRPCPEDLVPQFPISREMLDALGICHYEEHGVEADDIAGSLAKSLSEKGYEVYLYTSDRDYLQLIDERVKVLLPQKGLSETKTMDLASLKEEMGLSPAQIVDYKGLRGDDSDNLPGIRGVGEKTALKLLSQYGTFPSIMEHKDEIPGKLGEKVRDGEKDGWLSYRLARIKTDVPLPFEEEEVLYRGYDEKKAAEFAAKYEFRTFLQRLPATLRGREVSRKERRRASSFSELSEEGRIAIYGPVHRNDYHHEGLQGLALSDGESSLFVPRERILEEEGLREFLEDEERKKVLFDRKSLEYSLETLGIALKGVEEDILLLSYLLDSNGKGDPEETFLSQGIALPEGSGEERAIAICESSLDALPGMLRRIHEEGTERLYYEIELPLAHVLARMEREGIPLRKETLEEGKHLNQSDLLKAYGLHWYGGPVYGIVSRLTWQKGIDILLPEARSILSKGGNFVLLGSGEYELEQRFEELRSQYPDTCGIYIGYNDALAHKIYAGSDFFMMPSLFEPCGLSQMISQRYGTLPIVRMTGGLADTVHPYDGMITGNEDGLAFRDYNVEGLDYAVYRAEELYRNQEGYYKVARAAMGRDHSWRTSARGYLAEYKKLLARK